MQASDIRHPANIVSPCLNTTSVPLRRLDRLLASNKLDGLVPGKYNF
jgi:hypothetical protein